MAPSGEEITISEDHKETTQPEGLETLQNELVFIAKFLATPIPQREKLDVEHYMSFNRQKRLMNLFLDYFLPTKIFPETVEEDLAYLLAYNLLDVLEKEELLKEWYKLRGLNPNKPDEIFTECEDGSTYRSVHDLLEADSRTFGQFLPTLLKKMQRLRKYITEPLELDETTRYLDNIWLSQKPTLSKNDINVILYIDARPFAKNKEIAQAVDMHENSISYILDRLEKLCRFGVFGRPNLGKLGLQKIIVKTEGNITIDFPYLISTQELRAGNVVKLFPFHIPRKRDIYIREFYDSLKSHLELEMYRLIELKDNLSFQYYDQETQEWDIDWDIWTLWLERFLYKEGYNEIGPDITKIRVSDQTPISFDSKDLQIIDYYKNNLRMPMSHIGEHVGMTKAGARHRVKKLRDNDVIVPFVTLMQIGLDEQIVVLYTGEEEYLNSFEAALFELPVVYSYSLQGFPDTTKKCLLAWLQVPSGSFVKFADAVTSTLKESESIWLGHRYL
ncbi:winged helix-turn-helix transcriptional regulator, partial [Candidatus Borrarchaeum sp.]|uniref:winged helix-turn-helix transcriptional regulator n=1 Tax=Candidatus Borrarchaeum sp. TaxID=2846742 RepID=UPI00257B655F